jgi:hypothetical protein
LHEGLRHVRQARESPSVRSCSISSNPPGCAQTENGGKPKPKTIASGAARISAEPPQDRLLIEVQRVPLVPRLEQRDDRRDIGVDRVRQAIETAERRNRFDAGIRPQDVLDLTHHAIRALDRRAVRQAHGDEEDALIFVRKKSGRDSTE